MIQNEIVFEEKSFKFSFNNNIGTKKYSIYILNSTTKAMFMNEFISSNYVFSVEFIDHVTQFENICFEIKYPDESYESIIDWINGIKELCNNSIKIGILISFSFL